MIHLKTIFSFIFAMIISFGTIHSQSAKTDSIYMAQYNKNIKKPRINGVYIPKDLADVYKELSELSSPTALHKFTLGKEDVVAKKLALGLGRWMYVNWNFYEGSRISHLVKKKYGVSHPEDMSEFLIRCYHRNLNKKEIKAQEVADKISAARRKSLIEKKIIFEKPKKDEKM